jgi:hypothetical protein
MVSMRTISRTTSVAAAILASLAVMLPGSIAAAITLGPGPVVLPARLAYVTQTASSTPLVWSALASGLEPVRLGPGDQPLIAPSGLAVAASLFGTVIGLQEQGPAIVIYSTTGGTSTTYLDLSTATATPLAWSPDSRYLAVARQSTAVSDIAAGSGLDVIDTQTGTVSSIAEGEIYGASFATDGSDRIAYAVAHSLSPAARTNVYIAAPDGSGVHAFTDDGRSLYPLWGPRYIAYDRERQRKDAPIYQIWLRSPNGGAARRLTDVPVGPLVTGLVPIAFSASGSRLLAEFGGEDTSDAWTVRVPSGRAHELNVHGRSVIAAGISRDGGTLLVDEDSFEEPASKSRVVTVPFAGGRSKVLVAHGAEASWNG